MFKNWNKSSYLIYILGVIIITALTYLISPISLGLFVSWVGAMAGFLSVVLIVNIKKQAGYVGIVSALIYLFISLNLKNYSDSILNALFIIFLNLPLIINKKYKQGMKPNSIKDNKTYVYLLGVIFIVIYSLLLFIELKLGAPRPYISVLAGSLGIFASIMTSIFRLKEAFYVWDIQNIFQVILWSITFTQTKDNVSLILAVTYLFYTINASSVFFTNQWGFKKIKD